MAQNLDELVMDDESTGEESPSEGMYFREFKFVRPIYKSVSESNHILLNQIFTSFNCNLYILIK